MKLWAIMSSPVQNNHIISDGFAQRHRNRLLVLKAVNTNMKL